MEKFSRFFSSRPLWIGTILFVIVLGARISSSKLAVTLPNKVQDLITLAASILIESLPFVILGILLSIVIQVWVPARTITKITPQNPFIRRLVLSFSGILLPVCECGNIPLARGFLAKGFSVGDSLTFLLAAPILNPITLVTTYQAFPDDPHILIARALGALVIANLVGWLFSLHAKPETLLRPEFAAICAQKPQRHEHHSFLEATTLFKREATAIMPALLVGALIAGAIQVLVPREVLISIGSNPAWSILVMILLAGIISICSNVDAFFALAFSNTFTTGSIVSFLVFGPMIDIKMLALMRTTYTRTVLWHVGLLVTLMSISIGLVVQYAF